LQGSEVIERTVNLEETGAIGRKGVARGSYSRYFRFQACGLDQQIKIGRDDPIPQAQTRRHEIVIRVGGRAGEY
jgi:hypothetical protein